MVLFAPSKFEAELVCEYFKLKLLSSVFSMLIVIFPSFLFEKACLKELVNNSLINKPSGTIVFNPISLMPELTLIFTGKDNPEMD